MATHVKAIPDGYHTATPFLNVRGADKAIEFYKKAFGAEEKFRMPMPDGKVAHAELQIGDSRIMVSEAMDVPPFAAGVHLYVNDANALFERAVKAGAKVERPLADQFWGDRFGVISDGFGVRWSIATHVRDVPPDEMEKGAAAAAQQASQQHKK
jgi:PhnB protein